MKIILDFGEGLSFERKMEIKDWLIKTLEAVPVTPLVLLKGVSFEEDGK